MEQTVDREKVDLRAAMPETAAWVAKMRKRHGSDWVTRCIRDGMNGKPGRFYAIERGHVVGTPFPSGTPMDEYQVIAIVTGCTFAAFMDQPEPEIGKN